jgi:hypothetical protein
MVRSLREARIGLRQMRNDLEKTVLNLQTARLDAQKVTK